MMRQSNLLYALLPLVLITVSFPEANAKGMRYHKDKEDSYFSTHMKPCMVAARRSRNEDGFDKSNCASCNIEVGRTPFEKGMFEKMLTQCLSGSKPAPKTDMYQCGNKALCHSYVKSVIDCTKDGTCADTDLKSCSENCTPPSANNCIDEDKADFKKARALCSSKGAAQYDLLAETEVIRILERRSEEMFPQGESTTFPPQSALAKTSIFSAAANKDESPDVVAADTEVKSQTFIVEPTTNPTTTETIVSPFNPAGVAPALTAPAASPMIFTTIDSLNNTPSSRVKIPSEMSTTPSFTENTPARVSTTGEQWDTPSARKLNPSSFTSAQSDFGASNGGIKNLAPNNKIIADNATANNRKSAPAGTLESSSFQSGFHKGFTNQKKTTFNSLPKNSNIKASGSGAMNLDKMFSRRTKVRRGLAQQDQQWNYLKGKIGKGPHPVFLGVDHYFDKIRLDFNGEIAN